jgi:glycosyltransferase involved in cell wall biosynthesis
VAREGSLLIDITRLVDRIGQGRLPTGVDRVCLAYVRHFGPRAQAVLRWRSIRRMLPWEASQRLFALVQAPGADFRSQATRILARACLPPWPPHDGRGRIYFNHGHSGMEEEALRQWLQRTRLRPVYMVHDLIPLTHPEYCRPGEEQRHAARLRMLLGNAAGVLANSRHTADQLASFAQAHGLAMPPVQPVPLAPASLADTDGKPFLQVPYFVVVGTIEPRKNHLLLLQLWRSLAEQLGAAAPHLVVIGQRGWECENVVDLLDRCPALRGVVHELPTCTDAQLAVWLRHARALLFPSFVEGYGMPLVEALMLGTPAIASDLAVFRETAGEVPEYVDPLDGAAWREAVLHYAAAHAPRREAQLSRLEGFHCPTWKLHFEQVEDFLEQLR